MVLPLPPRVPGTPRTWVHVVVFAAMGMVLVAGGLVAVSKGNDAAMPIAFGLLLLCRIAWHLPGRGLGVEARDGALAIPMSRLRTHVPLAGSAVAVVICVITWGGVPALLLAVSWAVVIGMSVLRSGLGGEVRLDPEGVSLPPGHRLAWADAGTIDARRGLRVGGVRVLVDRYEVDPVLLYWTLRYYATHPESRDELADGRALDRVRREDLTGTPAQAAPSPAPPVPSVSPPSGS